jgi:hypothetical protein
MRGHEEIAVLSHSWRHDNVLKFIKYGLPVLHKRSSSWLGLQIVITYIHGKGVNMSRIKSPWVRSIYESLPVIVAIQVIMSWHDSCQMSHINSHNMDEKRKETGTCNIPWQLKCPWYTKSCLLFSNTKYHLFSHSTPLSAFRVAIIGFVLSYLKSFYLPHWHNTQL